MKSKRVNPPYIPFPNVISFSSYFEKLYPGSNRDNFITHVA